MCIESLRPGWVAHVALSSAITHPRLSLTIEWVGSRLTLSVRTRMTAGGLACWDDDGRATFEHVSTSLHFIAALLLLLLLLMLMVVVGGGSAFAFAGTFYARFCWLDCLSTLPGRFLCYDVHNLRLYINKTFICWI